MNATSAPPTPSRLTPLRRDRPATTRVIIALAAIALSLEACRCDSPTVGGPALPTPSVESNSVRVRNRNSVPPVVRDPTRIPGTYAFAEARDAAVAVDGVAR